MNDEKKIAQAIIDAQKMREESHVSSVAEPYGHYQLEIEECLIQTCKQQGLSTNLWALLNLTMHSPWWNDIQLWTEDILADKDILEECEKENTKMKDGLKQIGEEADNNTVVSIEGMLGGKRRKIIFDK